MSTTSGVATPESRPELIHAALRRLGRLGFSEAEAANLTALKNGFGIVSQPWTVRELTGLSFVRELSRRGGEWSGAADRATTDLGDGWRLPGPTPGDPTPADGRVTLETLLRAAAGRTTPLPGHRSGAPSDQRPEGR